MNKETRTYILMSIYRHTQFPINARGIVWLTDGIGDPTGIEVRGRGKRFSIVYDRAMDAFDCADTKRNIEGLYIDQLEDFIKSAK
jgi:hypothetical protein